MIPAPTTLLSKRLVSAISAYETSKICWLSAGSTSATRPSGFGGTGLARCSPPRFVSDAVARMRGYPQWRWHLDEVFVKVNGKLCYLWRAVDHEGEVLEAVATAKRDKAAALKVLSGSSRNTGLLAASSPIGFGHIRQR